ncbi:MAG: winged helix-turn-helix transcriptional regulator [Thaumarchaeota archaeon]|nr:winged helix-turn-helix transcriptional regulator [Nitrososphaerota archaeon]
MSKRYSLDEIKHRIIYTLTDIDVGLSGVEIAKKVGVNRITITKYLNVLEAIGLIKKKKTGSVNIWYLADGVTEFEVPFNILDVQQLYMNALFNYYEDEARRIIINVLHSGIDPIKLLSDVVTPTLNTAKELYSRGRITVTENIFIINLINESIDLIKFNARRDNIKPKAYAVFLSAQGESDVIGSKMTSVGFYVKGWNSYFLGNVASETDLLFDIDLLKFLNKISKIQRGLMIISISVERKEHLASMVETVKSIRSKFNKKMFILAEGETFNTENKLANDIGADFYATNLSSTIDWAEELYKKIKW